MRFGEVLFLLGLFAALVLLGWWKERRRERGFVMTPFGFDAKLVYADQGRSSKDFVNSRFGVRAKPDFVYLLPDGTYVLVEYKNRKSGMRDSDVGQVLASVLAVRSRYPVRRAFVATNGKLTPVGGAEWTDRAIYDAIREELELVRAIQRGKVPDHSPTPERCARCGYRDDCKWRV